MTKTELIRTVSEKADISQIKARFVVEAITGAVTQTLAEGDPVSLIGFGRFEVRSRAERTGDAITIPACLVPVFRTGKALKDSVRE